MVYEIHYFSVRGRAENTRLICAYGGFEFKNVFHDDWPARKAETPFGQLPVLKDTETGFALAQSHAIERYLAKKAGLIPTDDQLAALVDMHSEGIVDIFTDFAKAVFVVP